MDVLSVFAGRNMEYELQEYELQVSDSWCVARVGRKDMTMNYRCLTAGVLAVLAGRSRAIN